MASSVGMVVRLTNGKQAATTVSMNGQATGQIGSNLLASSSQAGNDMTQDRDVKNPLHGSVADSGDMIRRNSLSIVSVIWKISGTK